MSSTKNREYWLLTDLQFISWHRIETLSPPSEFFVNYICATTGDHHASIYPLDILSCNYCSWTTSFNLAIEYNGSTLGISTYVNHTSWMIHRWCGQHWSSKLLINSIKNSSYFLWTISYRCYSFRYFFSIALLWSYNDILKIVNLLYFTMWKK